MKHLRAAFVLLSVSISFPSIQLANAFPQNAPASSHNTQHGQIDAVIKKYADAYQYRNIQGLVAVWPSLQSNAKLYKKTKEFFDDARISNTQMLVKPLDWQFDSDRVVGRCERVEQYLKIVIKDPPPYIAREASPAHSFPGEVSKKKITTHSDVWITLRQNHDDWTIATINENNPH